jgi:hypothetical protein
MTAVEFKMSYEEAQYLFWQLGNHVNDMSRELKARLKSKMQKCEADSRGIIDNDSGNLGNE